MAPKILPYAAPVWRLLAQFRSEGKRILYEGAQGMMLDVRLRHLPVCYFSSNTLAGMATIGSGSGIHSIGYVLGITKAYTTRVGSGPFPSELTNEIGEQIGACGHEFGTVTGRKRRCGWFDAVMVKQAVTVGGINGIALTKLDVLDGLEELNICTGYEINGTVYDYLPAASELQAAAKPIYETIEGWSETTQGARSWAQLPAAAIKYVRRVEELIGCPVALLSTSPDREDTILVKDPFLGL